MEIKLKAPRHIHKPVESVQVDAALIDLTAKVIRYSVTAPGLGAAHGIPRTIKLSDEKFAELQKMIEDDAASIGE